MHRKGLETGLIRYSTLNQMDGKESNIIRPRIIIYFLILILLTSVFSHMLLNRKPIGLDIIRDRNQLFRETQGVIENVYTLKVINMDNTDHSYTLSVNGIDDIELIQDIKNISAASGQVVDIPIRLRVNEESLSKRSTKVLFTLTAKDNKQLKITQDAKFLGPQ